MQTRKRKSKDHPIGHHNYQDIGTDPHLTDHDHLQKLISDESLDTAPTKATIPTPAKREAKCTLPQARAQQCYLGVESQPSTMLLSPPLQQQTPPMKTNLTALVSPPPTTLNPRGFTLSTLEQACAHVAAADPKLKDLISLHGTPHRLLKKQSPAFNTLARSIVFQQLSTKAAAAIFAKVVDACYGSSKNLENDTTTIINNSNTNMMLTPEMVLTCESSKLRTAGLSDRKVSYLCDLAATFRDGRLSDEVIESMDTQSLHEVWFGLDDLPLRCVGTEKWKVIRMVFLLHMWLYVVQVAGAA